MVNSKYFKTFFFINDYTSDGLKYYITYILKLLKIATNASKLFFKSLIIFKNLVNPWS